MSPANARLGRGVRLTLASIALVQLAPVLNKFALLSMNAVQAATLNTVLVLGFVGAYRVGVSRRSGIVVKRRLLLLLLGLADAVGVLLLYRAIELISPVMFSLLGRFYTVFAVLLGVVWLRERLSRLEAVLVAGAIAATFLFSFRGVEPTSAFGALFAVGYTFFFALSNLVAKLAVEGSDSLSLLWYNKMTGLLALVVYGVASGTLTSAPIDARGFLFVASAALLSNCLGLWLFYESLRFIDFQRANMIRSMGPLLAAVYAWPWFPLRLSVVNWIGGAVLLAAVTALSLVRGRRAAMPGDARPAGTG